MWGNTPGVQGLLNKRQLGDADRGALLSWAAVVWGNLSSPVNCIPVLKTSSILFSSNCQSIFLLVLNMKPLSS